MLKFVRNTHYPNGIHRGDAAFQPLAQSQIGGEDVAGFVHMLASHEAQTLDETLDSARRYNAQFPDAPFADDPATVALILVRLCEAGLARPVWMLDETDATRAQKARVCADLLRHMAALIENAAIDGQARLISSLNDAATSRDLAA
jgi:hypothetical protein